MLLKTNFQHRCRFYNSGSQAGSRLKLADAEGMGAGSSANKKYAVEEVTAASIDDLAAVCADLSDGDLQKLSAALRALEESENATAKKPDVSSPTGPGSSSTAIPQPKLMRQRTCLRAMEEAWKDAVTPLEYRTEDGVAVVSLGGSESSKAEWGTELCEHRLSPATVLALMAALDRAEQDSGVYLCLF